MILIKLLMNGFAISTPVPCGIFAASFLIGSIIGKVYGIIMYQYFGFDISEIGKFSVVGAACFATSVTHTLAIIVIVFEITG